MDIVSLIDLLMEDYEKYGNMKVGCVVEDNYVESTIKVVIDSDGKKTLIIHCLTATSKEKVNIT